MAQCVLIVDDSEVNRRLLTKYLEHEYDLLYAKHGEEALAQVTQRGAAISAILLDLMMPVMDGFEVLKALRANPLWAGIPVIVSSTLSDGETRARVTALGARHFLPKPFEQARAVETLQSAIRVSNGIKDETPQNLRLKEI